MDPQKQVAYICVARRGDSAILAQRVHIPSSIDYSEFTKKVLSSPGWAAVATDKLQLSDGSNNFYVLIESSGIVFIAVASVEYPTRFIYDAADGRSVGLLSAGEQYLDFGSK